MIAMPSCPPFHRSRHPSRCPSAQRGLVLPVVLLLLVLITMVVAAQLRRGIIDERLAGSLRTHAVADSAVQTVLRWCELRVGAAPNETNAILAPARVAGAVPPWREAANWDPGNNRTFRITGVTVTGASDFACLIERADDELVSSISDTGFSIDPGDRERWQKFRITARVLRQAGGFEYAQSELRLYMD